MSDFKTFTQDDDAKLFNSQSKMVPIIYEIGIIKATTGRCYMFSGEEIRRFQNDYKGLDVSLKIKTLFAQVDA